MKYKSEKTVSGGVAPKEHSQKTSGQGFKAGKLPGNMMAHSGKNEPFKGTGHHPSNLSEVAVPKSSNPPAASLDGHYKAKLEASVPPWAAVPLEWRIGRSRG